VPDLFKAVAAARVIAGVAAVPTAVAFFVYDAGAITEPGAAARILTTANHMLQSLS